MEFDVLIKWGGIGIFIITLIAFSFSIKYLKNQPLENVKQKTTVKSLAFWLYLIFSFYCSFSLIGGWVFLPFSQFVTVTIWGTLLYLINSFFIFIIVIALVLKIDNRIKNNNYLVKNTISSNDVNNFYYKFLGVGILGILGYWVLLFPGVLSPDSMHAWGELQASNYTTLHSFTYTYLQKLLTYIWNYPAIISLIQSILYVTIIAMWMKLFQSYGYKLKPLWCVGLYLILFPINAITINSLWKDIPYLFAHLMSMYYSLKIISDKNALDNPINTILLGIFIALPVAFRHNGLAPFLVYIVIFALLALYFRKVKPYLYIMSSSLITLCFIFIILSNGIDVEKSIVAKRNSTAPVIMPINTAYIYKAEDMLPTNILELSKNMDAEDWRTKGSIFVNEITWKADGFQEKMMIDSSREVIEYYIQLWIETPGLQLRTRLNLINLAWNALSIPLFGVVVYSHYPQAFISEESVLGKTTLVLYIVSTMLQPIWAYTMIVLFFAIYIFLYGDKRKLIIIIPWIADLVCLFLISPATDYRYFWVSIYTGIFLALLTFVSLPKDNILEKKI